MALVISAAPALTRPFLLCEDDRAVGVLGTDAFAEKTHQLNEFRIFVGDLPHDLVHTGNAPVRIQKNSGGSLEPESMSAEQVDASPCTKILSHVDSLLRIPDDPASSSRSG